MYSMLGSTMRISLLLGSLTSCLLFWCTKGFLHPKLVASLSSSSPLFAAKHVLGGIELQSDESKYGRGEMHLSAVLDIGDIVVYQTGTWMVDGVEVGDGGPPTFCYGLVETIQLVWTHNCEHGVIRALPLKLEGDKVLALEDEECIEFGPEQLIAKLPLEWDEDLQSANSPVALSDELWSMDL